MHNTTKAVLLCCIGLCYCIPFNLCAISNQLPHTTSVPAALSTAKDTARSAPDVAIQIIEALLEEHQGSDQDSVYSRSQYILGLASYFKGDFLASAHYYETALTTAYSEQHRDFAERCYNNLGLNQQKLGNEEGALASFTQSAQLAQTRGDSFSVYQTYINIGFLYTELLDYPQAFHYLNQAADYFGRSGDAYYLGLTWQNMGVAYSSTQQKEDAIAYLEKAIQQFDELSAGYDRTQAQLDLLNVLIEFGETRQAGQLLETVKADIDETAPLYFKATIEFVQARLFKQTGKWRQSAEHLGQALRLYREIGDQRGIMMTFWELALLEGMKKQFSAQSVYLDSFWKHVNLSFNEQKASAASQYESVFNLYKKESEIKTIKIALARQRLISLGSIGLAALAVGVVVIIMLRRSIQEKNKGLFGLNKQLLKESPIARAPAPNEKNSSEEVETQAKFQALYEEVHSQVVKEQLYLDKDLTIDRLAYKTGINTTYLSQAISTGNDSNYNGYINQLRVKEAQKLILDPVKRKLGIEKIASLAGFSSKNTFYKQFKKHTGMTPGEFEKMAR
jgi:tetratricopeptide (TPR) repeat protein